VSRPMKRPVIKQRADWGFGGGPFSGVGGRSNRKKLKPAETSHERQSNGKKGQPSKKRANQRKTVHTFGAYYMWTQSFKRLIPNQDGKIAAEGPSATQRPCTPVRRLALPVRAGGIHGGNPRARRSVLKGGGGTSDVGGGRMTYCGLCRGTLSIRPWVDSAICKRKTLESEWTPVPERKIRKNQ